MNTYADKTQENKKQSVANEVSQKLSGHKSTFRFVDNRPEAIAQRKLREIVNNSPRVTQSRAVQEVVNNATDFSMPIQRMKQPLITNFFGTTHGHTLEDNPPRDFVINNITITGDGVSYQAILPEVNGPDQGGYGHLDLYKDNNGDMWINHIEVAHQTQRMGIATRLVQAVIAQHGHVYASNSPYDPGGADDTRHLSIDGAALVTRLINNDVMQVDWLRVPVV